MNHAGLAYGVSYGCAQVPGCFHLGLLEYGKRPGKKACCVLLPFRIRHYLYKGCPCTYGEGCVALDADVDDGGDGDGNNADVDD